MERRKIYDPVLRFLHAWNGLAILLLWGTAQYAEFLERGVGRDTVRHLHVFVGYALTSGLLSRLLWGFIGPKHARWSSLWHPAAWREVLLRRKIPGQTGFGHHPAASGAYLVLYGLLIGMAVTGLFLAGIKFGMGPLASFHDSVELKKLMKEPHEIGAYGILAFIALHLGALIWHEHRDGVPVAQSMISGFQYRRPDAAPDAARAKE